MKFGKWSDQETNLMTPRSSHGSTANNQAGPFNGAGLLLPKIGESYLLLGGPNTRMCLAVNWSVAGLRLAATVARSPIFTSFVRCLKRIWVSALIRKVVESPFLSLIVMLVPAT